MLKLFLNFALCVLCRGLVGARPRLPAILTMTIKKTSANKAAAIKKTAAKPVKKPVVALSKKTASKGAVKKTSITAKTDVGWGNSVYLRGVGGGLSWDVGVLMDNVKKDEWVWSCPGSDGPITFKFVRNDVHWALGPDHIAVPGENSVTKPTFPAW